jgi:UDP-N-acetylglucosamine--N-acetylmuramyl-(pentapeptide) pyrophosphoryl-undecaprenol N-acetylglucosamine transferase
MDLAYAAADVIISRAGAGTIAELCVIKKPVILVPSPNVAEDHQTKNALALVEENAAIFVADRDAEAKLVDKVLALLNDNDLQKKLSNNIGKLALPDADDVIAKEVIQITNNN